MAQSPHRHREQEQSIKERKRLLFEEEDAPAASAEAAAPRKPFAEYLRTTPAAPLSAGTRAALWATAVVVVLLLLAALWTGSR